MVGTIDQSCDILAVCEEAYQAAAVLCDREYLDHPELEAMAMDTTDENVATMACSGVAVAALEQCGRHPCNNRG